MYSWRYSDWVYLLLLSDATSAQAILCNDTERKTADCMNLM